MLFFHNLVNNVKLISIANFLKRFSKKKKVMELFFYKFNQIWTIRKERNGNMRLNLNECLSKKITLFPTIALMSSIKWFYILKLFPKSLMILGFFFTLRINFLSSLVRYFKFIKNITPTIKLILLETDSCSFFLWEAGNNSTHLGRLNLKVMQL